MLPIVTTQSMTSMKNRWRHSPPPQTRVTPQQRRTLSSYDRQHAPTTSCINCTNRRFSDNSINAPSSKIDMRRKSISSSERRPHFTTHYDSRVDLSNLNSRELWWTDSRIQYIKSGRSKSHDRRYKVVIRVTPYARKLEDASPSHELLTEALWDHITMQTDELPFGVGDRVTVTDWSRDNLWYGSCNDRHGWFPPSYVRTLTNQLPTTPLHKSSLSSDSKSSPKAETSSSSCRDSGHSSTNEEEEDNLSATSTDAGSSLVVASGGSNKKWQMRWRIVNEILSTERDYHQLITRLVQGFVQAARNRADLFPADKLRVIFGNLEDILTVHNRFLIDLENEYNKDNPSATCVGHSFLRHETDFEVYSDYCNNRPLSCAELAALTGIIQYDKFFECCRLLCDLPPLPLDGFLLTPVQRICRYPLQLAELVKATPQNHPDFAPVTRALQAMRRVATVINDRKRRLESLQKIAIWQSGVTGWKGDDLLSTSCRLYHYGEMTCRHVRSRSTLSCKDMSCFLFDRCIIMCRRDLLKRTQLVYKNRIVLGNAKFVDVKDGKDPTTGISTKHSIRLDIFCLPPSPSNSAAIPLIDDSVTGSLDDSSSTTDTDQSMTQLIEHHYILTCRNRKSKARWLAAMEEELKESQETQCRPITHDEKRIALAALAAPYEVLIAHASAPSAPSAELTRRVKQRTSSVTQLQSKILRI